jgi:hypothetical protein
LRDLSQLLLSCLERLLQGPELSLKLVTGLSCLGQLLLGRLCRLLQGCKLSLGLLSCLCDLGQLLLRASYPGLQVCQPSSGALLLIKLLSLGGFGLLQAGYFRLGLLPLVGGGEPYAEGQKPAQDGSPSQRQGHRPLDFGAVVDWHRDPPARGLLGLTQDRHERCPLRCTKSNPSVQAGINCGTPGCPADCPYRCTT